MKVPWLRFSEATAVHAPGLPYYAWSGLHGATKQYRPDFVELVAITGGEGRLVTATRGAAFRTEPLLPGQIYIFRPLDVMRISGVEPDGVSVICVAFPYATWEKFVMIAGLDARLSTVPEPPMIAAQPGDLKLFERVLERYQARPRAIDLIEFLVDMVPRFLSEERQQELGMPEWLWSAVSAMYEESNLAGGVARFTELSHVSPTHLWRSTRRYFGLSPSDLINEIQIRHAAQLLKSTDYPIRVVGERCGFPSPSHFAKAFRRTHQVSPREYRARWRSV